jgi:hypothetical protein
MFFDERSEVTRDLQFPFGSSAISGLVRYFLRWPNSGMGNACSLSYSMFPASSGIAR